MTSGIQAKEHKKGQMVLPFSVPKLWQLSECEELENYHSGEEIYLLFGKKRIGYCCGFASVLVIMRP